MGLPTNTEVLGLEGRACRSRSQTCIYIGRMKADVVLETCIGRFTGTFGDRCNQDMVGIPYQFPCAGPGILTTSTARTKELGADYNSSVEWKKWPVVSPRLPGPAAPSIASHPQSSYISRGPSTRKKGCFLLSPDARVSSRYGLQ